MPPAVKKGPVAEGVTDKKDGGLNPNSVGPRNSRLGSNLRYPVDV